MTDNTPTLCRDCDELTSGTCWRHSQSVFTLTFGEQRLPDYEMKIEWVNDRIDKITVTYANGRRQVLR